MGLRSEGSKFALSAFGLNLFPSRPEASVVEDVDEIAAYFAARFRKFLETAPEARFALSHGRLLVRRVETTATDVVVGSFREDGSLSGLRPFLDPRFPLEVDAATYAQVIMVVIEAYHHTRRMPEAKRPRRLRRRIQDHVARLALPVPSAVLARCIDRLLSACFVSFEPAPISEEQRCEPPLFRTRRNLGGGMLNVVGRWLRDTESLDLWMQVHHVGSDGAPMQETLSRLEDTWGIKNALTIPRRRIAKPIGPRLVSAPGERAIHCLVAFIDFTPLLHLRSLWKERFAAEFGADVPVSALLIWLLAEQPEFRSRKFAIAVDVPADARHARGVDLIGVLPTVAEESDVHKKLPISFVRSFQNLVDAARERRGATWHAIRNAALLPAWLGAAALRLNPDTSRQTFGRTGLTILRKAKIFVAPMSDTAFDDGFIAIGGMDLEDIDGGSFAAVTIKGEAASITRYPAAIQRAMNAARKRLADELPAVIPSVEVDLHMGDRPRTGK